MGVTIDVVEADGIVVATIVGEVDIANTSIVSESLLAEVSNDALGVVLDLSGLRYIDSTGVRMLFQVARRLQTQRRHIVLYLPLESPVRRLFEVSHFGDAMSLLASLDDARARVLEISNQTSL